MVTRAEMAEMARRYDTQVAAAFRRALGADAGRPGRRRRHRGGRKASRKWRGLRECFRNERSPMDSGR